MSLHLGIIGLPNVGKTLLFNAMTKAGAESASHFGAKKANIGIVNVPDSRLLDLSKIVHPEKIVPATVEFVDIAGLGHGSPHRSEGDPKGKPQAQSTAFLSDIRDADALIHVVRCFEDDNVFHVNTSVDPARDIETIRLELILADLESLERRKLKLAPMIKGRDKAAQRENDLLDTLSQAFYDGKTAAQVSLTPEDIQFLKKNISFLTWKPVIYVANISEASLARPTEHPYCRQVFDAAAHEHAEALAICAGLESDLATFTEQERKEYLSELGVEKTDLDRLIQRAFDLLGLMTFFTAGPKEVRAWTIRKDTKAPQAAGVIHSDIERGFIKADVITYDHYMAYGGEKGAKEKGLFRLEGKEYIMRDGDIVNFRFNV
ncbi:MAG: redox-regulated ATPase YchF [Peptococcaceae bacterium]|nr:redox-regulated ATPase YchF [Peptococcaceae bacterium]